MDLDLWGSAWLGTALFATYSMFTADAEYLKILLVLLYFSRYTIRVCAYHAQV